MLYIIDFIFQQSDLKKMVYFIPSQICILFGNGLGDRFSLRISLLLVLVGVLGLTFEIINAFDYIQGARDGF